MPLPPSFNPAAIVALGAEEMCDSPPEELDACREKEGQLKARASKSCGLRAGIEGSDDGEDEGDREGAACKVSRQTASGDMSSGAASRPDRTAKFRVPRAKPITKALAGNGAFAPGRPSGLSLAYAGAVGMSVGVGISGVEDAEIAMAAVAKAAKQKLRQLSAQLQAAGAQQAQGGQGGPDKDQLMLEIQIAMAEWSQATQAQSNIRSKADKTLDALVGNLK